MVFQNLHHYNEHFTINVSESVFVYFEEAFLNIDSDLDESCHEISVAFRSDKAANLCGWSYSRINLGSIRDVVVDFLVHTDTSIRWCACLESGIRTCVGSYRPTLVKV